jgi:hypothetical protein
MKETLSYEKLVEGITSGIARLETVTTTQLERNSTLQGRMDNHPVDLYWEFTDGDITYKTVIHSSCWEKAVSSSDLFKFVSLLRDIPGQTTGVLFSQPVYDKDIQQLAKDAGVLLFELSRETAAPRREAIVHNPGIQVDADWAKAEKERLGLEHETFQFSGDPKYLFLYDEQNNCVDSVHGVINGYLQRREGDSMERTSVHHYFETPTFLQTDNEFIPYVKLTSVMFDIEYVDPNEGLGDEIAQAVLAHVTGYYSR